jgi:stage V sporulation protein R
MMIKEIRVRSLPKELYQWQEKIEAVASEVGLDFFETRFEMLPYDKINEIAAYGGFPTRYPHWRFGMEYEKLSKSYAYGLSKIYEMVINTNPCYAYLLEGNTLTDQKLVMAHVYGHCDFFKNNHWFSPTNRKMIDVMANHASMVRRYQDLYGVVEVEQFIDYCLSLENLIDPHRPYRPTEAQGSVKDKQELPDELIGDGIEIHRIKMKAYLEEFVYQDDEINAQRKKQEEEKKKASLIFPLQPERDVLLFLMENAPLTRWQKNILEMIREEAYYFAPQGMTKIMNEGWACFWHSYLLTQKGILEASELIDYADRHSGTTAPHQGRINPYRIGLALFRDIFERWNCGKFGREYEDCDDMATKETWHIDTQLGMKKIFEVRKSFNDLTFLDEFLTPEFCSAQKLFTFEHHPKAKEWQIASRDFKQVKEKLLSQLTNLGQPVIEVENARFNQRDELLLKHRFEGVDLDDQYTKPTLQNIYRLWKRPVHLSTFKKDKNDHFLPRLISFNGKDFEEKNI